MTLGRLQTTRDLFVLALFVTALGTLLGGCRQYPRCKNDQHCVDYDRGTPFCVDRVCRTCRDDSHCGFCQQCDNNQCVHTPGCCADDADCPSPTVCRDGRCGPQCLSDDDCGALERCLSGTCTAVECRTDDQCPPGQRCENYRCVGPVVPPEPCADRRFQTVYFDFDESRLRADATSTLETNMACFERFTESVNVEGHCDERGTTEYNLALGDRRARAVRDWYETRGIPRSRMNKISYGENRPVATGSTENAWRQNRRVEITWR
ncbi:MAG: OmpA family protein [Myxococcales bacterium]|nr:OmpA family protein [Myxococcales bacterium]